MPCIKSARTPKSARTHYCRVFFSFFFLLRYNLRGLTDAPIIGFFFDDRFFFKIKMGHVIYSGSVTNGLNLCLVEGLIHWFHSFFEINSHILFPFFLIRLSFSSDSLDLALNSPCLGLPSHGSQGVRPSCHHIFSQGTPRLGIPQRNILL